MIFGGLSVEMRSESPANKVAETAAFGVGRRLGLSQEVGQNAQTVCFCELFHVVLVNFLRLNQTT
jgi:hypothetical protein